MEKIQDKNILKMVEYLKEKVESEDNESAHLAYDDILYYLAKRQDREVVKIIDKIIEDIDFWYA